MTRVPFGRARAGPSPAPTGATALRYYRSENATISASDTQVGTDAVGALSASGTSPESISLNAPGTAGTYHYGACVDAVAGESDTAASLWERAIATDLADIDFSGRPVSDGCTDGAFDGVVDDLRIYVRVESIDGARGTVGGARICTIRAQSGFPAIADITLDSADVGRLGSGALYSVAVHEMAHALGFGILWAASSSILR